MGWMDTGRLWRRENVGGGAVCFDGTGIIVEFVASRFAAGDSIAELAYDYNLSHRDIEAGLRLVVHGAFTPHGGLRADVERAMEAQIPLLVRRSQAVAKDGQRERRPKQSVARAAGKKKTPSRSTRVSAVRA